MKFSPIFSLIVCLSFSLLQGMEALTELKVADTTDEKVATSKGLDLKHVNAALLKISFDGASMAIHDAHPSAQARSLKVYLHKEGQRKEIGQISAMMVSDSVLNIASVSVNAPFREIGLELLLFLAALHDGKSIAPLYDSVEAWIFAYSNTADSAIASRHSVEIAYENVLASILKCKLLFDKESTLCISTKNVDKTLANTTALYKEILATLGKAAIGFVLPKDFFL